MEEKTEVTPYIVKSKSTIDYNKLLDEFKCSPIKEELIEKIERNH